MSSSQLRALSKIISSGIEAIESTYASHGSSYPSLDEPFRPDVFQDPAVIQASAGVIAAAGQLIANLQMPTIYLLDATMAMHYSAMIGAANEINLAEILRDAGPQGLHIKDIGLRAKSDPAKIGRILRYLATRHIFREVSPNVFATNKISSLMDTGKPVDFILEQPDNKYDNASGVAAVVGHFTHEGFYGASHLMTWLKNPANVISEEPADAPLLKAVNTHNDFFGWLEEPGNEHRLRRFSAAMSAGSAVLPSDTIVNGFDWASLSKDSVMVDVGGGVGAVTLHVSKAFPHLNYVIQDRAPVICEAEKFWAAESPNALETGQVSLKVHDFFKPQPIKNASVFFLRMILHDWSTKYSAIILDQLRAAAEPSTRLIILDMILPYAAKDEVENTIPGNAWPEVPPPLLPNLGVASSFSYSADINMWIQLNAQERTIGDFISLGNATGWKLDHVTRAVGMQSHLIFVPA